MKKYNINLLIFVLFFSATGVFGQSQEDKQDTLNIDKGTNLSILNLRPDLLNKGDMLLNFNTTIPRFKKVYNPQLDKLDKISPAVVLNEAYFQGYIGYGLSDKINLFSIISMVDINHYSPMILRNALGIGDIKLGADYQIIDLQKNEKNALSAELTSTIPTGKSKNLDPNDYPIGLGSFCFKFTLNGLKKYDRFNLWYSGYYDYRLNNSNINIGDETGFYVTLQKEYKTNFGNFGLEGGSFFYYNFKDVKDDVVIANSIDYSANIFIGAWYKYLDKYFLRFGIPYTVYQNQSWLTKYQVMIQLDYIFKTKKK